MRRIYESESETMSRVATSPLYLLVAVCALFATACDKSSVETLGGRWVGEIVCAGGPNDFSMVLDVFGEVVSGNGFTRTNESDAVWEVKGTQRDEEREVRCLDDTCVDDQDCVKRGGTACSDRGQCLNCKQKRIVEVVDLTLSDDNVQITDPVLELERAGTDLMEGTIRSFCPDEDRQKPTVSLNKQ